MVNLAIQTIYVFYDLGKESKTNNRSSQFACCTDLNDLNDLNDVLLQSKLGV